MSGFESQFTRHYAQIAQSVEQGTENPCVRGSIPRLGTIKFTNLYLKYDVLKKHLFFYLLKKKGKYDIIKKG